MLHRFRPVKDAKAADRGIIGLFQCEKILKGELFKTGGEEGGEFGAR